MRGKVAKAYDLLEQERITPAYAGKSKQRQNNHGGGGGSPPPMRGKDNANANFSNGYRITPAYAGKSGFRAFP